jgi:hypothetical protein
MQTIEQENAKLTRAGYPPLADCEPLHTPGPWLRHKSCNTFQIVAGADGNGDPNELVATIHPAAITIDPEPCDETRANARLISAAPEMFDALQAIVDAFGEKDSLIMAQAKAALAKAKGGAA